MIPRIWNAVLRLSYEPPFRLVTRFMLKQFPVSVRTRARWDISDRPAYLLGLAMASEQAIVEKRKAISAIEFGVAGGRGLLALQREAEEVEKEYEVAINVYGFDLGTGLPELIGDYRDHPEKFRFGDFPMEEEKLRAKLNSRTALLLGNVSDTVNRFFEKHNPPPIGFVSFDMDLYSSTRDAFRIFVHPSKQMLLHTPLYFDDMGSFTYHDHAGELLAIHEFNEQNYSVKIHPWAGIRDGRPFRGAPYLGHMFVAHDLATASKITLNRAVDTLPLQ
jgi:hypothetical protein